MVQVVEALRTHPFVRELDERHVEKLEICAQEHQFGPGEYLERQGGQAAEFHFILSGDVSLEISIPHQGALQVDSLTGGDVLGWSCMTVPYQLRFDARALTAVDAITVDAECLRRTCEHDHELGYQLLKQFTLVIGKRLDATRVKLLEMYSDGMP